MAKTAYYASYSAAPVPSADAVARWGSAAYVSPANAGNLGGGRSSAESVSIATPSGGMTMAPNTRSYDSASNITYFSDRAGNVSYYQGYYSTQPSSGGVTITTTPQAATTTIYGSIQPELIPKSEPEKTAPAPAAFNPAAVPPESMTAIKPVTPYEERVRQRMGPEAFNKLYYSSGTYERKLMEYERDASSYNAAVDLWNRNAASFEETENTRAVIAGFEAQRERLEGRREGLEYYYSGVSANQSKENLRFAKTLEFYKSVYGAGAAGDIAAFSLGLMGEKDINDYVLVQNPVSKEWNLTAKTDVKEMLPPVGAASSFNEFEKLQKSDPWIVSFRQFQRDIGLNTTITEGFKGGVVETGAVGVAEFMVSQGQNAAISIPAVLRSGRENPNWLEGGYKVLKEDEGIRNKYIGTGFNAALLGYSFGAGAAAKPAAREVIVRTDFLSKAARFAGSPVVSSAIVGGWVGAGAYELEPAFNAKAAPRTEAGLGSSIITGAGVGAIYGFALGKAAKAGAKSAAKREIEVFRESPTAMTRGNIFSREKYIRNFKSYYRTPIDETGRNFVDKQAIFVEDYSSGTYWSKNLNAKFTEQGKSVFWSSNAPNVAGTTNFMRAGRLTVSGTVQTSHGPVYFKDVYGYTQPRGLIQRGTTGEWSGKYPYVSFNEEAVKLIKKNAYGPRIRTDSAGVITDIGETPAARYSHKFPFKSTIQDYSFEGSSYLRASAPKFESYSVGGGRGRLMKLFENTDLRPIAGRGPRWNADYRNLRRDFVRNPQYAKNEFTGGGNSNSNNGGGGPPTVSGGGQAVLFNRIEGVAVKPVTLGATSVGTAVTSSAENAVATAFEKGSQRGLFLAGTAPALQIQKPVTETRGYSETSQRSNTRSAESVLTRNTAATRISSSYLTGTLGATRTTNDYLTGDKTVSRNLEVNMTNYLTGTASRTAELTTARTATRTATATVTVTKVAGVPRPPIPPDPIRIIKPPTDFPSISSEPRYSREKRRKKSSKTRRNRDLLLSPFADLFSKTTTESLTLKPAKSPSERVSAGFWRRSYGQRVPTAEMLKGRVKGLNFKKRKWF